MQNSVQINKKELLYKIMKTNLKEGFCKSSCLSNQGKLALNNFNWNYFF